MMTAYYTLLVQDKDLKSLHTAARDRAEALALFGKELHCELTEAGGDEVAPYLMDEFTESPHWTNPTIPIFRKK